MQLTILDFPIDIFRVMENFLPGVMNLLRTLHPKWRKLIPKARHNADLVLTYIVHEWEISDYTPAVLFNGYICDPTMKMFRREFRWLYEKQVYDHLIAYAPLGLLKWLHSNSEGFTFRHQEDQTIVHERVLMNSVDVIKWYMDKEAHVSDLLEVASTFEETRKILLAGHDFTGFEHFFPLACLDADTMMWLCKQPGNCLGQAAKEMENMGAAYTLYQCIVVALNGEFDRIPVISSWEMHKLLLVGINTARIDIIDYACSQGCDTQAIDAAPLAWLCNSAAITHVAKYGITVNRFSFAARFNSPAVAEWNFKDCGGGQEAIEQCAHIVYTAHSRSLAVYEWLIVNGHKPDMNVPYIAECITPEQIKIAKKHGHTFTLSDASKAFNINAAKEMDTNYEFEFGGAYSEASFDDIEIGPLDNISDGFSDGFSEGFPDDFHGNPFPDHGDSSDDSQSGPPGVQSLNLYMAP